MINSSYVGEEKFYGNTITFGASKKYHREINLCCINKK